LSPLSGEERKSDLRAVRSVDGPLTDLGSGPCDPAVDFTGGSAASGSGVSYVF